MATEIRTLQRRKATRRRFIVIGMLLVACALVYIVYFSSVFALRTVSVLGSTIVANKDIIQAASITPGTPLAQVDSDEILKNLQVFPSVGSVEVRRVWPSEIVLAITERTPIATMSLGGRWKFVDKDGVMYGDSAKVPDGLIPISAQTKTARAAVASVVSLLPSSIQRQVLTMHASSEDSVELTLTGNRQVFWGNASLSKRKIQVLQVLLQKKARMYDVSAPNFPTTKN